MAKVLKKDEQPIAGLPLLPSKMKIDVKQPIVLQSFTNNKRKLFRVGG